MQDTTTTTITTTPSPIAISTSMLSTEAVTTEPPLELIQEQWLMEQLAKMTLDEKVSLGFNFADLILDCRFAGSECTDS